MAAVETHGGSCRPEMDDSWSGREVDRPPKYEQNVDLTAAQSVPYEDKNAFGGSAQLAIYAVWWKTRHGTFVHCRSKPMVVHAPVRGPGVAIIIESSH